VRSALEGYLATAKRVELRADLTGMCRDPKDDMLFECAIRARAEIIVSGDKDVLQIVEYRGVRVLTARRYLSR
jgi:predicted nucleic acid-binding protein